ncbi:MAG: hypothetical protein ACI814_001339 [Mariniblastus sp.]|jgi:hypothetical protein
MLSLNLIETVNDICTQQDSLLRRSYGMIEAVDGKFVRVQLRPWPKLANLMEARWLQPMKNKRRPQDVCRLYYNQPIGHRNFLTISYIESSRNTSWKTLFATLEVLYQIGFIKRTDAMLAEIANPKISDRMLTWGGWERHREGSRQRHWIRRFYGTYPEAAKSFMLAPNETSEILPSEPASHDKPESSSAPIFPTITGGQGSFGNSQNSNA